MANYSTAVLAKGQAMVSAKYQAPEQRRKMPTALELALKNQEISIPDANDLRKSEHRPVEINYYVDIAPGVDTVKESRHTGTYGDSKKVSLTYVTHVEKFALPRKIAESSIDSYQSRFSNLYEMKWKNLRTRHDDSALAFLKANRCQIDKATMDPQIVAAGVGNWNEDTHALEISAADALRFPQRLKAFFLARKYPGSLDVLSDLKLFQDFEMTGKQGAANYQNLAFQLEGLNIGITQDQISADYPGGAVLALPAGQFAGMYWNEGLNKRNGLNGGADDYNGSLGTVADPLGSGAVADISVYTDRADTSADTYNGSPQDVLDYYELTLTIAYALPPLNTANDSVLHLIGQSM